MNKFLARSVEAAAQEVEVNPATLHRWLSADPAFGRAYRLMRRSVFATAQADLSSALIKAARVLTELLDSDKAHLRLTAARAILE